MLIASPCVLVDPERARVLLDLLLPEAQRRQQAGRSLSPVVVDVIRELDHLTRDARSDPRSEERSDPFRAPIVDGVTTAIAAERLGICQRAVIGRLHRETLRGIRQGNGTWLVDAADLDRQTGGIHR